MFCNCSKCAWIRLSEDDADASENVGVLSINKILCVCVYIYIYIYIYIYSAFVGVDNKVHFIISRCVDANNKYKN